jgi:hypothetical protein
MNFSKKVILHMTRSPLRGTPRRHSHDDDNCSPREQTKEVVSLAKAVSDRLVIRQGPPHTEEEKRATYLALARLKAQRFTREECAAALGVSVSSVARYLADPLYEEVRNDHMAESKQRGHFLISEAIDDALDVIYSLMHTGKSEFVRYKAAEKLLDIAGYNVPRVEQQRDNREGLLQFMRELESRRERQQPPQVTVNIHQQNNTTATPENQETMIEAASTPAPALPPYSSQVLPGGKLPDDFLQAIDHHPVDHGRPEQLFASRLRREDDNGDDPYS